MAVTLIENKDLKKGLKESYYDGKISFSELSEVRDQIDGLIEMMDDAGVSQIQSSPNTYGIGTPFIGTRSGYIDLSNPEKYVGQDEDDEYVDYEEESLKESGQGSWVQVNLKTGEYCGNGGRSWVQTGSSHIDRWDSKEAAIKDGKDRYKKSFKYGINWDVKKLDESLKEGVQRELSLIPGSKPLPEDLYDTLIFDHDMMISRADNDEETPVPWDADFEIEGDIVKISGGIAPGGFSFGKCFIEVPLKKFNDYYKILVNDSVRGIESDLAKYGWKIK